MKSMSQKTHIIEPAVINVTYKHTKLATTLFEMRAGKTTSSYFKIDEFKRDSLLEIDDNAGALADIAFINQLISDLQLPDAEFDRKHDTGPTWVADKLYYGIVKGKTSLYTMIGGTRYVINEDAPEFKWNIEEDSTKNIYDYQCTKATTDFRGRHWVAWFNQNIPIDAGPWKLCGLPGLILKAKCYDYVTITCVGINIKNPKPVTFYNFKDRKYKEIDHNTYLRKSNDPSIYPGGKVKIAPKFELE